MTAMLSENVTDTISFFKSECTIEEFYWLSSIFEDIIAKTQSTDLISIWRSKHSDISPEKFKQEKFKSELMQSSVTYDDYINAAYDLAQKLVENERQLKYQPTQEEQEMFQMSIKKIHIHKKLIVYLTNIDYNFVKIF